MINNIIIVHETPTGEVEVSEINSMESIGSISNEALKPIAAEVSSKLQYVIEGV